MMTTRNECNEVRCKYRFLFKAKNGRNPNPLEECKSEFCPLVKKPSTIKR
jgi:hypothetical protein